MVDLVVNVKAPGLSDLVNGAAQTNESLKQAAQNSQRISAPVRAAAYSGQGETKTARSIGSGAGTGSSASDFAAQASGLGGLVHLYATFAANIYAASAAFNALKDAMNVMHLTQGLDQLSASSGKNLGTLAAQLNKVTDGALNMQQSMTAVASSSALGMTSDQILKMGEVAKKASQAMGYDMAAAMERLTKGINLGRPQLLDEIGIIINLNTVHDDYARSVGKTAASLTDYEKKQSVANAVLQQGLDKFGVIDIPTNPFNKLEAAVTNTLNSMLGFIDKGIGPIVKYLSESPTGLIVAMTTIASTLVKQAIPAIGAFRENAKRLSDEAIANANIRNDAAKVAALGQTAFIRQQAELSAQTEQKILQDNLDKLQKLRDTTTIGKKSQSYKILQKAPQDVTEDELKLLDRQVKMLSTRNAVAAKGYQDAIDNIVHSRIAYDDKEEAIKAETAAIQKSSGYFTTLSQTQRIADKANQEAKSRNIASTWAENTATQGFFAATKQGWDDVKKARKSSEEGGKGLNTLQATMTGIKGTTLSAVSSLGTLISSLSEVGQIISAIVGAYTLFDSWASKATEQQSNFNDSLESGKSAAKVATDAIEFMATKVKDLGNTASVIAMSNAMEGLTSSINSQIDTYKKWEKAAGVWDKVKDKISSIWGGDNATKLANSMGKDIDAIFSTMIFTPGLKEATQKELADLFKVDPSKVKSGTDISSLLKLKEGTADFDELSKKVGEVTTKYQQKDAATTAAVKSFSDAMKTVDNEIDIITNKLQFKDGIGKLGEAIIDLSMKLSLALDNPLKSLSEMIKLVQDPKLLSVLQPGQADALIQVISSLKDLQAEESNILKAQSKVETDVNTARAKLSDNDIRLLDRLADINAQVAKAGSVLDKRVAENYANIQTQATFNQIGGTKRIVASNYLTGKEELTQATKNTTDAAEKIKAAQIRFADIAEQFSIAGTKMVDVALKEAQGRAALTVETAKLSYATQSGLDTSKAEYNLRMQEIGYKREEVNASFNLQKAILENTRELNIANARMAVEKFDKMKTTAEGLAGTEKTKYIGSSDYIDAQNAAKGAQAQLQVYNIAKAQKAGSMSAEDLQLLKRTDPALLTKANTENQQDINLEKKRKAANATLDAKATVAALQRQVEHYQNVNKLQQDLQTLKQAQISQDLTSLSLQEKIAGGYVEELANKRKSLEVDNADSVYQKESLALNERYMLLIADIDAYKTDPKGFAQKEAEIAQYRKISEQKRDNTKATSGFNEEEAKRLNILALEENTITRSNLLFFAAGQAQKDLNDKKLQQLGFDKELGNISDNLYNTQKDALELSNRTIAYEDAKLIATNDKSKAEDEYNRLLGEGSKISKKALDDAKTAFDLKSAAVDKLDKEKTATDATALAAAKHRDILKEQADILSSMTALFGDMGTNIFNAGKAMENFANQSAKNAKALEDAKAATDSPDKDKKVSDLEKKISQDKVSGIIAVASAQKKMFGEQTVANKALTAIEKGASLERISLAAKEAGFTKEGIQQAMANASQWIEKVKDGTLIQGIQDVIAQGAGDPYTAIPRMIAMASFVSSLTGQSISGPPPVDQGTLAGTGQQVGADGQTIGTRAGGVLGDPKATVKAITDSVEGLSKVFFNTMGSSSSNMITHLKGIQENTFNTAKALGAAGFIGGSNPFGAITGSSAKSGLIGNIMSFLGGSSTSSVTGAGITGTGTASQFASGEKGFQGYTNIQTETTGALGGIFGGNSSTPSVQYTELDKSIQKGLQGIFRNFKETLLDTSKALGQTSDAINKILDTTSMELKVSNVGLTGTEFAQKLQAEVTVKLNDLTEKIYPWINAYVKVGEESFQVASKLIKDGETVNFGLKMVGTSLNTLNLDMADTVAQQQKVLENFGGTADDFAAAMEKYYGALFSDSEKAKFAVSNVQEQLKALGITGVTTNEQLKALISTQDPTGKLYADLVKLVPAFTDATAAAQKMIDSYNDQEAAIYNLLGQPTKALEISRAKELDALDATLRPRQLYINALTDEIALRDKLKAAYTSSNNALTTSIKTLNDYKTALTQGAASTLTPSEKYAQAKSIFMQTAAAAQAAITANSSATDIATRDAAIAKIQSTGDALMSASREVNASGAQYAADFKSVTDAVDITVGILSTQQTDQQKQLGFLDSITTATETTAQLLAEYLKARDTTSAAQQSAVYAGSQASLLTIPGHARGGLAQGISLVGEQGPEIVDFKNPGRVYSNQASNDMFNNKELIAEIKALREEVCQLRDDQNKQTGDLIQTTIQSNVQNAQMIVTATANTINQQDWKTRSQVRVA